MAKQKYAEELKTMTTLARQAGKISLKSFGQSREHAKGAKDVATDADLAIQELLKDKLSKAHPEYGFLGEEGQTGGEFVDFDDLYWVVDPIDGTLNYSAGIPHYAVSIGLVDDGCPVAGVVYDPVAEELYSAEKGCGATLNGKRTSAIKRKLSESMVEHGFGADMNDNREMWNVLEQLIPRCRRVRSMGSDVLGCCYVGAGRTAAFVHHHAKPWDLAASMLIATESGAKASDFDGNVKNIFAQTVVCASSKHYDEIMGIVTNARK